MLRCERCVDEIELVQEKEKCSLLKKIVRKGRTKPESIRVERQTEKARTKNKPFISSFDKPQTRKSSHYVKFETLVPKQEEEESDVEKRDLSEHEIGEEPEMSKLMEKNLDREEEEEEKHWREAKRMVGKHIESLYIAMAVSVTSKSQKTKSKKKTVS